MAIEPLQLPGPLVVPKIDWSPLDKVGDAYIENQRQQREAAALAGLVESIPTRGEPVASTVMPTAPRSSTPNYRPIPYSNVIGGLESSNKYDELGPVTKSGDRAFGKYQVMGANVGPWTKEALGKELTPQEFLADPAAQDAVFKSKFGQYTQKYGPEGAARAWFAGEGGMNDLGRRDQLGTSVGQYGQRFASAAGAQPAQLPLGLRNNNPGYIPDGAVAKALPGYKGAEGGYATFDTPENGLGAMDALLTSFNRRGIKTVGEVVRQLPGTDSNNADAMARFVSPNGDPNAIVDLSDPAQRQQMVGKMAIFANGMHGGMGMTAPTPPPTQAEMATAARGMTPEMKKRVQALFAAGTPLATQAGLALISKFIGKQEPIKLAEGDVLVDPDTGQIIGRAPGKSQAVREGGAIVQDGKLIYQAPDRPQAVAPGSTLTQNGKPILTVPANAQFHEAETPEGIKTPLVFDPQTRTMRAATPEELGGANQTGLPPEVNPKAVREQRSKDFVANEQAATLNAKAAADFKPLMDQAVSAYERATKAGGVGPVVGSTANRFFAAIGHTGAEKARQDYDTALAGIQARIVAAQNKGEGQVSNFERALYASQFPNLQRLDPEDQIKYLKQLQAHTNQTIETGGKSMLGKQPSIITERPAIGAGKTESPAAAGQPQEGDRQQFKQGWGVFHNGQWVPAPTGPRA